MREIADQAVEEGKDAGDAEEKPVEAELSGIRGELDDL